ncbi:MAG: zf-HC2 domain-containing protein [Armatimonadetes bacterium]|nr:zf-HC2 domain-containing protein [Armatimonadota bacterium]MDE2207225.1 zf-HC2 domain-containing protein [Armatimonadota bacterium]
MRAVSWPLPFVCRRTRRALEAQMDGQLPAARAAAMHAHTAQCAACRAFQNEITQADQALTRYGAALRAVPDFAIAAAPAAHRQPHVSRLLPVAFALGACALAIVLVPSARRGPVAPMPTTGPNRIAQAAIAPTPTSTPLIGLHTLAAHARPRRQQLARRRMPTLRPAVTMIAMSKTRSTVPFHHGWWHKPAPSPKIAAKLPVVQLADAQAAQPDDVRITITDDVRGFTSTARLSGGSGSSQLLVLQADAPVSGAQ